MMIMKTMETVADKVEVMGVRTMEEVWATDGG